MITALDLFATGLQLAGFAGIAYGAVLALEIDVLVDRLLKARPLPAQTAAA
jgi:hypothetical protein